MGSTSVKRVALAVLVVLALGMVVPTHARAATLGQNSFPGTSLWEKTVNWVHHFLAGGTTGGVIGRSTKFGAAHTNDGHSSAGSVQVL